MSSVSRLPVWLLGGLLQACLVWLAATLVPSAWAQEPAVRPKVGLVLSGGGARGLAHVGVLEVLERERIPVDMIAGTSMGAIVGGLYASGMSAADIEKEVVRLDWDRVFSSRVGRTELAHRLKEQDFEVAPLLELGVRGDGLVVPLGPVSSRELEGHLRRMTLKAGQTQDFDRLPTPFRAVATDMENGQAVILQRGDLARALRSSMSIPAVFAPVEIDGRILGDGGLVNNVPVDVARAMGAQRLIVVNVGTPLSGRETLDTLGGLTSQMLTILTEQNVALSLRTLTPRDVLITPQLNGLSAGDFTLARQFIERGRIQGEAMVLRMQDLKVSEAEYARWKAARVVAAQPPQPLVAVEFRGSRQTRPERLSGVLDSRSGEPFDPSHAERDIQRLAATGDYVRTDYQLVPRRSNGVEGDALVFRLEDKPWGPSYLQMGLDFSTDTDGRTGFNLKLVHTRRWLDDQGTEWRNFARLGTSPQVSSELFRPLSFDLPNGLRPFVAGKVTSQSESHDLFNDPQADPVLRLTRRTNFINLDAGASWRELGDLRLGIARTSGRDSPDLITPGQVGLSRAERWVEQGVRTSVVLDQLDAAYFATRGWRLDASYFGGQRSGADLAPEGQGWVNVFELKGQAVTTLDRHGLQWTGQVSGSSGAVPAFPRFGLGGFQRLSGYGPFQLSGQQIALGTVGYTYRLAAVPLTRGLYAGTTLELGKAWNRWSELDKGSWRYGGSLYLGADTAMGPVHLGIGAAQGVTPTLMLFVGRP